MKPVATLVPMGTITAQLGDQIELGSGPKGVRLISDVVSVEVDSDRIKASLATNDAADWLTISDSGPWAALTLGLHLKLMTARISTLSTLEERKWQQGKLRLRQPSRPAMKSIFG